MVERAVGLGDLHRAPRRGRRTSARASAQVARSSPRTSSRPAGPRPRGPPVNVIAGCAATVRAPARAAGASTAARTRRRCARPAAPAARPPSLGQPGDQRAERVVRDGHQHQVGAGRDLVGGQQRDAGQQPGGAVRRTRRRRRWRRRHDVRRRRAPRPGRRRPGRCRSRRRPAGRGALRCAHGRSSPRGGYRSPASVRRLPGVTARVICIALGRWPYAARMRPWREAWRPPSTAPAASTARGSAPAEHFRTSVHASPLYAGAVADACCAGWTRRSGTPTRSTWSTSAPAGASCSPACAAAAGARARGSG